MQMIVLNVDTIELAIKAMKIISMVMACVLAAFELLLFFVCLDCAMRT